MTFEEFLEQLDLLKDRFGGSWEAYKFSSIEHINLTIIIPREEGLSLQVTSHFREDALKYVDKGKFLSNFGTYISEQLGNKTSIEGRDPWTREPINIGEYV